jgi:exodeoxyribonuclease V alpha subunit
VSENPYRLSSDVDGIGFVKADDVARPVLGDTFKVDMPYRIRAGLVHTLREARSNGHVFLPYGVLVSDSANLLNIQAGSIRPVLDGMPDLPEPEIIIDQGDQRPVYLVKLYDAERLAAHQLKLIAANTGRLNDLKESLAEKITAAETGLGFTLTEQQRAAVFMALSNKVSIITGGPGVGKSTILKLVTDVLAASHKSFALCSPTGRASKRLAEATKQSASTIHRLLEFNPLGFFAKCEENPINADVIIVDEMSMVDMSLFHFLLKAVPISTHLLMVGDADQLPSVGAGDVLHELIRSQQFPVTTLTNIFRQGKNSHIVSNAHEINAGHMPDLIPFPDWLYIEANDQESIQRAIVEAVCNQLPKAGYSPTKDVQVLLPMYKTEAGVNKLNMMLRERLNPMKAGEVERKFRAGDKVMQLKNNYQLGVFNGDMGYVADIRLSDDVMVIDMDGHSVEYPLGGLDQLTLAYACTIHKSQGSEYPVVVMGLSSSHYIMLKRNLIYTGITRGKQLVILVGDKAAIQTAVKRAETAKRYTLLSNRLKGTQGA